MLLILMLDCESQGQQVDQDALQIGNKTEHVSIEGTEEISTVLYIFNLCDYPMT